MAAPTITQLCTGGCRLDALPDAVAEAKLPNAGPSVSFRRVFSPAISCDTMMGNSTLEVHAVCRIQQGIQGTGQRHACF